jgi:ubiquinone/menaquinone biosynthesis C-methylase UbiE
VQPQMLEILSRRLAAKRITNVTLLQGTVDDPKLAPASVDLELMVDVYHELSQPQSMLRHLREALKPGGRLVLLEYRKEDPTIPIKPDHKMSVAEAKLEVEAEGFTLWGVDEALPRQHILIFTVKNP